MTDPMREAFAHLFEAGFTREEIEAIHDDLAFVVTVLASGETGSLGELGAGKVAWTDAKTEAYLDFLRVSKQQMTKEGDGS